MLTSSTKDLSTNLGWRFALLRFEAVAPLAGQVRACEECGKRKVLGVAGAVGVASASVGRGEVAVGFGVVAVAVLYHRSAATVADQRREQLSLSLSASGKKRRIGLWVWAALVTLGECLPCGDAINGNAEVNMGVRGGVSAAWDSLVRG
jgi:hypothetical protein